MKKPILRYFGSKWRIGREIIGQMPKHSKYVDVFGGSAAILLQKDRSAKEVYNDKDLQVANFFRQCRENSQALIGLLRQTPYSRASYNDAFYDPDVTDLENARRFFVRSWMGVGGEGIRHKSGFRRSYETDIVPEKNYARSIKMIDDLVERVQGVIFENMDFEELIRRYDSEDAFFYCDPPYLMESRTGSQRYRLEFSIKDHERFLSVVKSIKGTAMVSGYPSALYDDELQGWQNHRINANTTGQKKRVESIWLNRAPVQLLFHP